MFFTTVRGQDDPLASFQYAINGELLAGPGEWFDRYLALGADGVSYVAKCVGSGGNLEVVALSPSLDVIDRLDLGPNCFYGSEAVLLDDGLLIVHRRLPDNNTELVRIATASPGLAKTAWPTKMRDNA
ncbi:MAG: hypothetical protein FWD57_14845, partial [Polyangiaceae bacterium]|nr:hypothetical protein [Polyangiaceae bacterium]